MIKKSFKKTEHFDLKLAIVNMFMRSGKKRTSEKILQKASKRSQKLSTKNFKKLTKTSLVNLTSAFKINEQVVRKGRRKTIKVLPAFLARTSRRVSASLKLVQETSHTHKKSLSFYEAFASELMVSFSLRSQSFEAKTEIQKQVLTNKKYLSKFRW